MSNNSANSRSDRGSWASSHAHLIKIGSGIAVAAFVIGWWYDSFTANRNSRRGLPASVREQARMHRMAIDERPGGIHRITIRGADPNADKRDDTAVRLNDE